MVKSCIDCNKSIKNYRALRCRSCQSKQTGFKKNYTPWNKGKNISEITKKKISMSRTGKQIGHSNYFKGMHPFTGKNYNEIYGESRAIQVKKKLSESHIGNKHTPETLKKALKRNFMSSLEIKFNNLVQTLNLPYKFVGHGEILIGGKSPDFIHTQGKYVAVEVFYKKHKEIFRNGFESWKKERANIFKKEGYELVFFDETEVKSEILKRCLPS